jgi:hypothetical protein
VAKASLTIEQASELIAQLRATLDGQQAFLEIIMPNGKKMRDCTSEYVGNVANALQRIELEPTSRLDAS